MMEKILKSFKTFFGCVNANSANLEIDVDRHEDDEVNSENDRLVEEEQAVGMIVAEFKNQEDGDSNCDLVPESRVIELDYYDEEGECDEIVLAIWSEEDRNIPYIQAPVYL
ncbi:PREDICTED: uncharacterized protein LOC108556942 [Nicrophorus vespilloides]|uniref:Uncharacterized protein LOC108556942 n=1 Tax=Nicrophorus vespilloides TaxID=110193 RepID=A0ABM1M2I2_NICVS|nr:PREDICTED: uncharacterized protein LOC108556942 [Nicrophorus vespilloides]